MFVVSYSKKKMCSWRFLKIFPNQATKTPKHVCRAEMSSEALAPWSCRGIESLTSTNHISLAPKKTNPGVTCVKSLDTSNQTWWSNRFCTEKSCGECAIRSARCNCWQLQQGKKRGQFKTINAYIYTYIYIYIFILYVFIYLSIYLFIYLIYI